MGAEGGQECLSCTAVESASDCNHRIQCDDNELCYMHHYITESGTSGFDFGCASQQVCSQSVGTIFGRRSEGHHAKCTLCCDDSKICNEDLNCTSTAQTRNDIIHALTADSNHALMVLMTDYNNVTKYAEYLSFHVDTEENGYRLMLGKYTGNAEGGQECLSCTAMESADDCDHRIQCGDNEACSQSVGTIFGRRSEGHHVICTLCCYDSRFVMKILTVPVQYKDAIQRRFDESVNFYRDWQDYKNGFGQASGEYWIGDSLWPHSGHRFTTYDRDNDIDPGNCAQQYRGAWWYSNCHDSNLNGLYLRVKLVHMLQVWYGKHGTVTITRLNLQP
ncbi:unnamed protein product [Mytilus edulis]|uniref:Fibrinogen C-terminal domain-containing protein n=1 Tax=Mytilus edulis TaxID=6550 RepID=A0A8S3QG46_MYTED|nr:unnamed protein product [Mytilus edulis]